MWTVFKGFIDFVTVLLPLYIYVFFFVFFCFFLFLFFSQEACEILAPQPGIEPLTSALEGKVVTTGQPETSPHPTF